MLRRATRAITNLLGASTPDRSERQIERPVPDHAAMDPRVIAVDWSGARTGAERSIWLAEVRDGVPVRLENGRARERIADQLIEEASRDERMVVGFDFAFSLPEWFLRERDLVDGPSLWSLAARDAEVWLAACESPFWGRPGVRRPELPGHLRRTDEAAPPVGGIRPKSVFQIGGAGAVGTGALRGMPILDRLRRAGFRIWPFDPPGWPLVVEIYPRLLTDAVTKSDAAQRAAYLAARYPVLSADAVTSAGGSEDAFDALVSALVMDSHRDDFGTLPAIVDPGLRAEGLIWYPGWRDILAPMPVDRS